MTNPNKRRGDLFEQVVRDHCRARGFDTERTRAGYARDHGDIHLVGPGMIRPGVILQTKNHRTWCLPEWLREVREQRDAARADHGFLILKRRGVGNAGQSYAVLPLDDLLTLLAAYRPAPEPEES